METRKEALSNLEVCRFCLAHNDTLIPLYDKKTRTPKNSVPLALKILACIAIEIFPSDKMPRYICKRCKFFMELSYVFKQLCRQSDEAILEFVQHGSSLDSLIWPTQLDRVYKSCTKSSVVGVMKTVVQGGVKVLAEEVSDSEEGEDDSVYNIKIGDGPEDCKSIKIITSVDKHENASGSKNRQDSDDGEDQESQLPAIEKGCFACDECEATYPLEQLLDIHKAQKHSRERTVECDVCNRKFFTKSDLTLHQGIHTNILPFQCSVCGKKFKRHLLLKRHEKQVHAEMPQHSCANCPATFLSTEELHAHQAKHNDARPFICLICKKRFRNKLILNRHTDIVHSKKADFSCQYCSEQFASVSKLARHVREHAGSRGYPCKHCGKSFLKSHHYTRHLRLKHQTVVSGHAYRCEECEATFTTQDELLYHSALHATKNLVCPLCQEKFDDVDAVTAHIKSHVNGSEFMCDYCELIFTSKEKLDVHTTMTHDDELANDQELENDELSMEMGTDNEEDGNNSFNVKEENGHMVVEIKNSDEFMLPANQRDDEEKADLTQSEDSDMLYEDSPNETPEAVTLPAKKPSVVIKEVIITKPADVVDKQNEITKPEIGSRAETVEQIQPPNILMKAEEIKRKAQQQAIPQERQLAEKKEKSINKVETSAAATGASDKSLRLLEKELQDLKRTNTIIEASKTPSRAVESLRRRPQLHASTPKTRIPEKKDTPAPKPLPEKVATVEKKQPERKPTKDKELKEVKSNNNSLKEDRELKDKGNGKENKEAVKEDKKEVKEKETPKSAPKNGASEATPAAEESVRRSSRPSKVKDYAKMIRDSSINSDEDESEKEDEEEYKEEPKSEKTPEVTRNRVGRPRIKPLPAQTPTPTPTPTPRKRGRPRKEPQPTVPSKIKKDDPSEDDTDAETPVKDSNPRMYSKDAETSNITEGIKTPEANKLPLEANSNIILSPSGQPLKQIPIKSLPPGIKPLPLPANSRLPGSREVCEMQIGKKVVKVQKIVMTKAEVEAMAKKGLVEMKDGTMVLKQGIKLPTTDHLTLKSKLMGQPESKKESLPNEDKAQSTPTDSTS